MPIAQIMIYGDDVSHVHRGRHRVPPLFVQRGSSRIRRISGRLVQRLVPATSPVQELLMAHPIDVASYLVRLAKHTLLGEAELTPKPGRVGRRGAGAHTVLRKELGFGRNAVARAAGSIARLSDPARPELLSHADMWCALMTQQLDDTCVLYRGGLEGAAAVKSGARAVLAAGGSGTQAGVENRRGDMEQIEISVSKRKAPHCEQAHAGVAGSGDMEVLMETSPEDGAVRIQINDAGATPASALPRLEQAVEVLKQWLLNSARLDRTSSAEAISN